jgi:hypothetical protein
LRQVEQGRKNGLSEALRLNRLASDAEIAADRVSGHLGGIS